MPKRLALLVLTAFALLCSCEGGASVGLGRFRVTATRGANTCGVQSMSLDAVASFDVELKVGNGTLRWTPARGESTSGSWSASLRAFRVLLQTDSVIWPADRRRQLTGCAIRRTDVVEGSVTFNDADAAVSGDAAVAVDGGNAPVAQSFTATETIVFGPTPDSDCRALVGSGDGQYNTMPCQVTYTLSGVRTGDASPTSAVTF
jgi:hypothetical protein